MEDEYLVYNYTRFQACRFGLDGAITHPKTYQTVSLREDILQTLTMVAPHAVALDSEAALLHLRTVAEQSGDAAYLRQQFAQQGSAEAMVDAALRRFRGS